MRRRALSWYCPGHHVGIFFDLAFYADLKGSDRSQYSPHVAQGKHAEAERLYKMSHAVREKIYGAGHPGVAGDLNNRAGLLKEQVSLQTHPSHLEHIINSYFTI